MNHSMRFACTNYDCEYLVIGTGTGGSVAGARLGQAGTGR